MAVKYRIQVVESERGWGQERWTEEFDTYEQARARINEINSKNTSLSAPDWYMQADSIVEALEVDDT